MTGKVASRKGARRGRTIRHASRSWRGQSLVELALLLPLFTVILLGAVDFGQAFLAYNRLSNAVHEGALYAAQFPASTSDIQLRVTSESSLSPVTVSVTCYRQSDTTFSTPIACDGNGSNQLNSLDWVQVTATYNFRPMTARMLGLFPSGLTLRKTVRVAVVV
ncbi:MAG TPA: TadE/TadG family type IV pilus assembly protein [Thermomicrobiales bacterium]|nr:TadE/TadG family type IV pilus assembly protein [Thermomicrobiales bacterium]